MRRIFIIRDLIHNAWVDKVKPDYVNYSNSVRHVGERFADYESAERVIDTELPRGYYQIEKIYVKD